MHSSSSCIPSTWLSTPCFQPSDMNRDMRSFDGSMQHCKEIENCYSLCKDSCFDVTSRLSAPRRVLKNRIMIWIQEIRFHWRTSHTRHQWKSSDIESVSSPHSLCYLRTFHSYQLRVGNYHLSNKNRWCVDVWVARNQGKRSSGFFGRFDDFFGSIISVFCSLLWSERKTTWSSKRLVGLKTVIRRSCLLLV